jgi:hypothetical protein
LALGTLRTIYWIGRRNGLAVLQTQSVLIAECCYLGTKFKWSLRPTDIRAEWPNLKEAWRLIYTMGQDTVRLFQTKCKNCSFSTNLIESTKSLHTGTPGLVRSAKGKCGSLKESTVVSSPRPLGCFRCSRWQPKSHLLREDRRRLDVMVADAISHESKAVPLLH